jgi:hypothetical protein
MDERPVTRRSWPRLVLTIPPDTRDRLHELARANYRDPRREALRLLLEGIERAEAARSRAVAGDAA